MALNDTVPLSTKQMCGTENTMVPTMDMTQKLLPRHALGC